MRVSEGRHSGILPNLAESLPHFVLEVGVYANAWAMVVRHHGRKYYHVYSTQTVMK